MTRFQTFLLVGTTMLSMAACSNKTKTLDKEKLSDIQAEAKKIELMEKHAAAVKEFKQAQDSVFSIYNTTQNDNDAVYQEQLFKLVNHFNEDNDGQHIVTVRDKTDGLNRFYGKTNYHLDMTSVGGNDDIIQTKKFTKQFIR